MTKTTIAAAVIGAAMLAAGGASAQVLTASSWLPPTHTLSLTQAKWCEEVSKATANRVRCNILPKPVTAPPGTFDAVRDGLAIGERRSRSRPGQRLSKCVLLILLSGDRRRPRVSFSNGFGA
jgi:hypothetical protein